MPSFPPQPVRVDGGEEVYTAMLDETCFNPANSNGKTVRITLQRDIDKNDGLKNIAFEFSQTEAPAQIVLGPERIRGGFKRRGAQ